MTKFHIVKSPDQKEKAILVGVVLPKMGRLQEEDSLNELAALADTAGAKVVGRVLQERKRIDPATYIGSGKMHDIARRAEAANARLIIFDADLSPVQIKNLQKELKRKVLDRSGLILDIFASRAKTREAKIQVELAQLEYLLPRLTRHWTHLSRQEAGIGTRGPGETQLEVDRRAIRKLIGHLKDLLKKIERQRCNRRKSRQSFIKAALIGYTNVGKSSLLNALTDSNVFVENRLFATLDATIRGMDVAPQEKILLIDTVGFIRKLPHHLVASFRSTLEESIEADILLHVVDVSHPNFEDQLASVLDTLHDLEVLDKPIITVFNKVDAVEDQSIFADLIHHYKPSVFTSAIRGIGLTQLLHEIQTCIKAEAGEEEVRISINETRTIAMIHEIADILKISYEDGVAVIRFRAKQNIREQVNALIREVQNNENTRH